MELDNYMDDDLSKEDIFDPVERGRNFDYNIENDNLQLRLKNNKNK